MTATLATSRGQGKSKQAQQRFIRQIRTNVRDITPLDYFSIDNKITQTADNQQASYKPTPKGEAPSTEIINSLIAGGFATKAAHMLASDSSIAAPNEEVEALTQMRKETQHRQGSRAHRHNHATHYLPSAQRNNRTSPSHSHFPLN